jgi:hypothetical protein
MARLLCLVVSAGLICSAQGLAAETVAETEAAVVAVADQTTMVETPATTDAAVPPVPEVTSAAPTRFEFLPGAELVDSAIETADDGEFRGQVGFYWIRPQWDDNMAYGDFTLTNNATAGTNSIASFNYDFSFSPRVTASYVLPVGLGFRARYWQFNQGKRLTGIDSSDNTTLYTSEPLGLGLVSQGGLTADSVMTLNSGLKLYAMDFEVTKDLQFGNLKILYWGGMRYAHIAQDYDVVDALTGGGSQTLSSGHNLNGFGPTVGIEDRYAIGTTGLSFFGNIRGSLLAGNGKQVVSRVSEPLGNFTASDSRNDLLPIGDLEVGGEYQFTVGSATCYIQLALVCQAWLGAANSSRSNGSAQPSQIFPQLPDTSAVADGNLGLYGLTANFGLDW